MDSFRHISGKHVLAAGAGPGSYPGHTGLLACAVIWWPVVTLPQQSVLALFWIAVDLTIDLEGALSMGDIVQGRAGRTPIHRSARPTYQSDDGTHTMVALSAAISVLSSPAPPPHTRPRL